MTVEWRPDQFHPMHGWGARCVLCVRPEGDEMHDLAAALKEGVRWDHAAVRRARARA